MACTGPQQVLRNGHFQGDAPELVDALVQASRIPAVAKNACPSLFGRELVPWQADSAPCSPVLDQALEHEYKVAGRANNNGKVQAHNTVPRRSRRSPRSPRSDSPCLPESGRIVEDFACPALAHAPRPESLPMPTFGLLSRAGTRSRSPSPPKDTFNGITQHIAYAQPLVSPVAA